MVKQNKKWETENRKLSFEATTVRVIEQASLPLTLLIHVEQQPIMLPKLTGKSRAKYHVLRSFVFKSDGRASIKSCFTVELRLQSYCCRPIVVVHGGRGRGANQHSRVLHRMPLFLRMKEKTPP